MYDEFGTKLVVTRIRPSFVARLLWTSNSASEIQPEQPEPAQTEQQIEHVTDAQGA